MSIENFCEFIKKIHDSPFDLITDLTIKDYYAVAAHLKTCENCAILVTETIEKNKDKIPGVSPWDQTRFN